MKLNEAAKKVEAGVEETLTYCNFPSEHWTRIRTNNVMMLVCARLRHVAGTQWGNKKYRNMKHLVATLEDASIAG